MDETRGEPDLVWFERRVEELERLAADVDALLAELGLPTSTEKHARRKAMRQRRGGGHDGAGRRR